MVSLHIRLYAVAFVALFVTTSIAVNCGGSTGVGVTRNSTTSLGAAEGNASHSMVSNSSDVPGQRGFNDTRKTIHIIGFFALTGHWPEGLAFLPAALLAMKHINTNHSYILPGYRLQINPYDTQCSEPVALKALYSEIYNPNRKSIMILGGTCSPVTEITSSVANLTGLQQISYSAVSPLLSDKSKFPTFFRVMAPEQNLTVARVKLFQELGWSRVHTIYEDQKLFSTLNEYMKQDLIKENIQVLSTEMFTVDPKDCAENLKKNDARIIIGSMYEDKARMLMCEIYNSTPEPERPTAWYKKVVWLLPHMFFKHWMDASDPKANCSSEKIQEVLGNYFTIGPRIISKEPNYRSDSGLTDYSLLLNGTLLHSVAADLIPPDLESLYTNEAFYHDKHGVLSGQHRAPQAYDAVWAIAIAINNTLRYLRQRGNRIGLENFNYSDPYLTRILHDAMRNVSFNAISGPFQFNNHGERAHNIVIFQYNRDVTSDDKYTEIGHCYILNETHSWNCSLKNDSIVWPQGRPAPPVDGVPRRINLVNITSKYKYIFWGLSSLGIALTVALLAFNISKRNHRIIKMSSPNINNVILVGCLVAYSTVFIIDNAREGANIACVAHTFTIVTSFSLSFGALFAKTWRVYEIFTAELKVLNTKMLKDKSLFLIVGVLVMVNNSILIGWAVASPQAPTLVNISTTPSDSNNDVEYVNQYQRCDSKYRFHFMSAILAIEGIVILFGTFLAIQTRKVTVPELNDSKWIAMCIYNVVVLSPVGVVVVIATADKPPINYALEASILILITSMTECLIFVPKIITYRNHNKNNSSSKKVSCTSGVSLALQEYATGKGQRFCSRCQISQLNDDPEIQTAPRSPVKSKVIDVRETDLIALNTRFLLSWSNRLNLQSIIDIQVGEVFTDVGEIILDDTL